MTTVMTTDAMQKQLGITEAQAIKAKKLYKEISDKITMDSDFNCHFKFKDYYIYMRPMTRKLSRDYTIFLQSIADKKNKDEGSGLSKYNKYQDLVENALRYTITNVYDEYDQPIETFDIDELPDPVFDELVLYLNMYFQKYKKK